MIRKHNEEKSKTITKAWYDQVVELTKRDQLNFNYALWKKGITADRVLLLGDNFRGNPYLIVDSHR